MNEGRSTDLNKLHINSLWVVMFSQHVVAEHAPRHESGATARADIDPNPAAARQVLRSMESVLDRAFKPALELPLPDDIVALIGKLHAGPLGRTRRKPRRRAA
jgi:hypothetical protein